MGKDLVDGEIATLLQAFVGQTISRVRRVHFDYRGDIDFSRGSIEITAGTLVAWFHGSGGHVLARQGPWIDVFADPTEEDMQIVAQWGKASAFDMTDSPDYASIVGHQVESATPTTVSHRDLEFGQGFDMTTDAGMLRGWDESDEFYVVVLPR